MFKSSVCSYPNRGPYGNNQYRGNCTGYIIKDFIESYLSSPEGIVVDPSIGGGTSCDVAKELGVNFVGTDLHQGFNLLTDDLKSYVGKPANLIWWHPPYGNMLQYSGVMFGEPNKWDMSRLSVSDFAEALKLALMNIHDACEPGGHYGILMGNLRKRGEYYNFSSLVERLAPGKLVDEIIKIQHNCVSDSTTYKSSKLVRIAHEKLLVFKRPEGCSLNTISAFEQKAIKMVDVTWKTAIRRLLQQAGKLPLGQIFDEIPTTARERRSERWQEKVKCILSDKRYFNEVSPNVFTLAK